jgi:hypothetical protein
MSKLTKTQWQKARATWEWSAQDGFQWLATELGVSRPAVAQRAKTEHWTKKYAPKVTQTDDKSYANSALIDAHQYVSQRELTTKTTKWHDALPMIAYQLCLLGFTNKQLAESLDVSVTTLKTWRNKYPDFDSQIKRGKLLIDANVAASLHKTAMGSNSFIETQEILLKDGSKTILKTIRSIPPNFNAQRLWLRNRQPERWGR